MILTETRLLGFCYFTANMMYGHDGETFHPGSVNYKRSIMTGMKMMVMIIIIFVFFAVVT